MKIYAVLAKSLAMYGTSGRAGWTLAALALTINIVLSIVHMGIMNSRIAVNQPSQNTSQSVDAKEQALFAALAQICTGHGLVKRPVGDKGGSDTGSPTCPLCFFFAVTTLYFAVSYLLIALRRREIDCLRPLVSVARSFDLLQRWVQSRAPPARLFAA